MSGRPISPRFVTVAAAAAGLLLAPTAPAQAQTPAADAATTTPTGRTTTTTCRDVARALGYEEAFLARPEAQQLIDGGGFRAAVRAFEADLCRARSLHQAQRLVHRHAARLWDRAVDRVQGRGPLRGWLSRGDDRPLYWARLSMVAALKQWKPAFPVGDADRSALVAGLDRVSRGQDDVSFPANRAVRRVLVTGFDPFTLHRDVRQANPSGASALALDGRWLRTKRGLVRVEAMLFPVRWRDFADGMVERALAPHFARSRRGIDLWATTSQGRPGRFDLEVTNGAWRAGFGDNEGVCYRGQVPVRGVDPAHQPQWVPSKLPMTAMAATSSGAFPVVVNRQVVEVPAGTDPGPVTTTCPAPPSPGTTRPDGPTAGSLARAGGGGNYLSNEIAYRATYLRDRLGRTLPGGHIHTPVLTGLSSTDPHSLTTPEFEANRSAINDQVRTLVIRVVEAGAR